jgi:hypothetical protein
MHQLPLIKSWLYIKSCNLDNKISEIFFDFLHDKWYLTWRRYEAAISAFSKRQGLCLTKGFLNQGSLTESKSLLLNYFHIKCFEPGFRGIPKNLRHTPVVPRNTVWEPRVQDWHKTRKCYVLVFTYDIYTTNVKSLSCLDLYWRSVTHLGFVWTADGEGTCYILQKSLTNCVLGWQCSCVIFFLFVFKHMR